MDGFAWIGSASDALAEGLRPMIVAGVYAALLAVVVLAVNVLFRRWLSAGQMGMLWALVLLRLVVPVAPGSSWSLENLVQYATEQPAEEQVVAMQGPYDATNPASFNSADEQLPNLSLPMAQQPEIKSLNLVEVAVSLLPLLWAVVGVAGLAYTLIVYSRFCRRVNRAEACDDERTLSLWKQCCSIAGVKRACRVVLFDGVEQPAIMGVFRPTLLLPASALELDDAELRMVMLHELAHVRRWDIASNWALVLVRAIHWWNPVYWLAAARFRSLREQACDAFVIRRLDGQPAQSYGSLLMTLAQRPTPGTTWRLTLPASILSFFPARLRQHALRVRLAALRRAGASRGRWQLVSVATLLLVVFVSGFTVAKEEVEEEPDALATFIARHPDAVPTPKHVYEVEEEIYSGPKVTRTYDIRQCLERIEEEHELIEPQKSLLAMLKQFCQSPRDSATASESKDDSSNPLSLEIDEAGTSLIVNAPVKLQERVARMLAACNESGFAQTVVETRFISSQRDLITELGATWQFLEAYSAERDSSFPEASRNGEPVVRAESRIDQYLPIVVSKLDKQQKEKLIEIAQWDRKANVLMAPKVTIFNGQDATIADCTQRPFVVGVYQPTAGVTKPKIVVVDEGTKIKVRAVQSRDRKHVKVAASLEMSSLGDVETASTTYRGEAVSIQVPRVNRRNVDIAVDLENGQSLLVAFIPTGAEPTYPYCLLSADNIPREEL